MSEKADRSERMRALRRQAHRKRLLMQRHLDEARAMHHNVKAILYAEYRKLMDEEEERHREAVARIRARYRD
jgi:hypothetical protein